MVLSKFPNKTVASLSLSALVLMAVMQAPVLAAEDRAEKASGYYEDALVRMQRDDAKGAIVQLKNALQQDSKMLPALVLLGRAYLKAGQPLGADRVLADAERLGADRSEIIAYQAEVYNLLGKNKDLLERFSPDGLPPDVKYKVLVTRSYAQMDTGKEPAAVQSAEQARQIDPSNPSALVAKSMAYLRMNNLPDADNVAQQAITVSPADPSGWNMKASIAHARGDFQGALAGYGKALSLEPKYLDALIGRASLLLDLNKDKDAAPDVASLVKNFPDDARSSYLQALLAGRQGNNTEVRNALIAATSALDALPFEAVLTRPQLVLLGGVSHYSLGQNEKAKTYLGAYLKKYPRHMGALKLLASIMMGEGKYAQAIAVLEGPARATPNDPQALSMLASCYMALKQHTKAVSLLDMATELSGGNVPDISANFGLSLIGSGQVDLGVAQLQKAYSKAPGSARSGLPLALMYMKQGQTKSAQQVLQAVLKKEPDNLTALNVLGVARGLSGDREIGRAHV
jgi:putative PEP-CTERM system TPR-repeat lipoprotein